MDGIIKPLLRFYVLSAFIIYLNPPYRNTLIHLIVRNNNLWGLHK